jgi:hypothetical protein
MGGILLGCLFGLGIWGALGAARGLTEGELMAAFDEANRLYEQGRYEAAAAAYDQLLADAPATVSLHYNLGNAFFKTGNLGMAIWHYRVAQDLSPRDADIRANLQFARQQVGAQGQVPEGRMGRWVGWLTLDEWSVLSVVLFWGAMGGMTLARLKSRLRWPMRIWVRLLIVVWLGSVLSLGAAWHEQHGRRVAVVMTESGVRYGPFEESQVQFAVPAGAELEVMDFREDWVRVEHGRQGAGWMEQSRVRFYPGP